MGAFTGTFRANEVRGGGTPPPVTVTVAPGATVAVPSTDPNVVASPTTAWLTGEVATFSDGAFHWNGTGWVAGPAADAEPEADDAAAPRSDWTVPQLDAFAADNNIEGYPLDANKPEKLAFLKGGD